MYNLEFFPLKSADFSQSRQFSYAGTEKLVIFMAAVHRKAAPGMGALAIGGTVFLTHLVGIPLTNAGINPARTFGPALLSGYWEFHWLYWAAPIVGGIIAGVLMNYIYVAKSESTA